MKTIIQISVLLLAILVGSIWQIFKPGIHDFLVPAKPMAVSAKESTQITEPVETIEKTETAKVAVPENPPLAESGKPQKTESGKADSEPTKVVIAPKPPVVAVTPAPIDAEAMKKQEVEEIQRIVLERYPDIPNIPFSEKYPNLDKLNRTAYPERIQIHQELNLKHTQEGKIVGVGVVKAEGYVRPRRVEGDKIGISSLVNDEMKEQLPLAETDFLPVVEANYDVSLKRAMERIEKMREADESEIVKNPNLYRTLIAEGKIWHELKGDRFENVNSAFKQQPVAQHFKLVNYFDNGFVLIDEDGPFSGGYSVVILMLEGLDSGFGPYRWRARCVLRENEVIGWLGLPDVSDGNF